MPHEKIRTKRAAVDATLFLGGVYPQGRKTGAIRLLYCGRLSPEKNLAMLLHAFAGLRQKLESPRMILKFVGHGPQGDSLRKLAGDLGCDGAVEFAGPATQTALPQIFRHSDVLVLPSKSEPWGLVVVEAMLSGLPVAVSERCGCVADLVKPETGWTFSPDNEADLTRLLARIADTPREILEEMGRAGRSLASGYSVENCATAVLDMVNRLLHVSGGAALGAGEGG
jgi:glycosyltransferase involved in cell wall biosynthesis